MKPLSWASISEQLRAIGVEVPVTAPQGTASLPRAPITYRPPNLMCRRSSHPARISQLQTR